MCCMYMCLKRHGRSSLATIYVMYFILKFIDNKENQHRETLL